MWYIKGIGLKERWQSTVVYYHEREEEFIRIRVPSPLN